MYILFALSIRKLSIRHFWPLLPLLSKGMLSSIEDQSSINDTFQPYVNSGTIRPIKSPHLQACYPPLEIYQFSRVLDDYDWV